MRDRWQNRADTKPGHGTTYWHILLSNQPKAVALAGEVRKRLSRFSGLHMTPLERLHITTLLVGSTDSIATPQITQILDAARHTLADVQPVNVSLGKVLYHPEAIMLGINPQRALDPILTAVQSGMRKATGLEGAINEIGRAHV